MDDKQKLNKLLLKRADYLSQLEMLTTASNDFYLKLGKIEADIHLLKRKILRETKNLTDED